MNSTIFVVAPTGNIGGRVVADLLRRGETVHVLARSPEKLPQEVRDAVTVHVGDLTDEAFVTQATVGASALFWLTPPAPSAPDVRAVYAKSAEVVQAVVNANAIPYVVHLSSLGAQNDGLGEVTFLRLVENALNTTAANVVHLRPGYFFENFLDQADAIKSDGAILLPLSPEFEIAMVATADIAVVAAQYLAARDFVGKTYHGIHGAADLSLTEAARQLGSGTGLDIRFVQTTMDQAHAAFEEVGMGADFTQRYMETYTGFAANRMISAEPRTADTTTPTTLEAWAARMLKPLVNP
ncbi:MAG: NAD(P)H-binding protein [Armatimonadetes bacterium]|nr:NAD(P)H-binding protein [Armatimonadota bacterium]